MKFTDRYVQNLKPRATRYLVQEENSHGNGTLRLRVSPNGHKAWEFTYSIQGRVRRMTLGTYPAMSVAEAHAACGEAMRKREQGIDPGAELVRVRFEERQAPTFKQLANTYLELHAKPRKKSASRDERILDRDVLPVWGPHKAEAITRRDVIALLDCIVARGAPIQANRTLALVRKVFNFAIGRDIVQHNPCYRVPAPGVEHQRDRVLSDDELKAFVRNLPTASMSTLSKLVLRLQLLTAQRCGEVIGMRWDEVDLDSGWWTIPATRAKNKLAHRVPLSPVAKAVLQEVRSMNLGTVHVFPSPRLAEEQAAPDAQKKRKDVPMVETAVSRALLRAIDQLGTAQFTPHDLRRTAASHMTGMGVSRLVVSRILNHVERGVTAVYDRHSYDAEKRAALERWAARVGELMAAGDAVAQT